MKILGIDSSADTVAIALLENEKLLASFCGNIKKTHSNTLLPAIDYILNYSGISASDIDLYSVSVGPGSFTGIRIGVATVKGLAFGSKTPVCGVSSLEAMAYSFSDREGTYVCPVLNARRGDVYNALFIIEDGKPCRITDDTSLNSKELEHQLSDYGDVLFCGDGVSVLKSMFDSRTVNPQNELINYPSGCGIALAGFAAYKSGIYTTAKELAPLYLKPAQAERERLERLKHQ